MVWEMIVTNIVACLLSYMLDILKNFKDKNSPIKRELRKDVERLIYDWKKKWKKVEELLYNKYVSWHEHENEIKEWVEAFVKENPISDKYFNEIFSLTINRIKSLTDLINKQIDWYDKNLDLYYQLNKEKNNLIKCLEKDLGNFFWVIFWNVEKEIKNHWLVNLDDFNTANKMVEEFIKITVYDASDLIDKIIEKISVNIH